MKPGVRSIGWESGRSGPERDGCIAFLQRICRTTAGHGRVGAAFVYAPTVPRCRLLDSPCGARTDRFLLPLCLCDLSFAIGDVYPASAPGYVQAGGPRLAMH